MMRVGVVMAMTAALVAGATAGGAAPPVALLTAVHVATQARTDRVSFSFRSLPRVVRARFVRRPELVAVSGRPVRVSGSAFLVLDLRPASGVDLSGAAPLRTYRGAKRIRPTTSRHVREVVELEDFEGVLRWAVGLDRQQPYTISRTASTVVLTVR